MRELLEVSFQRAFETFSEELMEKRKEQEKKSLLRPSALTAIIQLMHARSRWPTVMAELTFHPRLRFSDLRYKFVVVEVVVASRFVCDSHHTEQSNNMNFHN